MIVQLKRAILVKGDTNVTYNQIYSALRKAMDAYGEPVCNFRLIDMQDSSAEQCALMVPLDRTAFGRVVFVLADSERPTPLSTSATDIRALRVCSGRIRGSVNFRKACKFKRRPSREACGLAALLHHELFAH